jgi:hypothetical protein
MLTRSHYPATARAHGRGSTDVSEAPHCGHPGTARATKTGQLLSALYKMNERKLCSKLYRQCVRDTERDRHGRFQTRSLPAILTCRPAPSSRPSSLEETASSMEELTSDRHAQCRQRTPGGRSSRKLASGMATRRRRGRRASGADHGLDQRVGREDCRHHRRHRRHRLPDQHPGAECGRGSGARRRAGPRFRGGRQRKCATWRSARRAAARDSST